MPHLRIATAPDVRFQEPAPPSWALANQNLASEPTPLHFRARAYRSLAELLKAGPTSEAIDEARVILGADLVLHPAAAPITTLRLVMADSARQSPAEWHDAFVRLPRRCANPRHEARLWACTASRVAPDESRATDLLVLATMAEDIDLAHRRGHEQPLAGAMNERRIAFLADHAGVCLRPLARDLTDSSHPMFAGFGRALRMLLATEPNGALAA